MPIANRSTTVRAKPTGCGRPSGDGAYAHGSNVAGARADGGEEESLIAERRGFGNSRAEKRADLTWLGKATGRDSVNATISMCTDFLAGTGVLFHFLSLDWLAGPMARVDSRTTSSGSTGICLRKRSYPLSCFRNHSPAILPTFDIGWRVVVRPGVL